MEIKKFSPKSHKIKALIYGPSGVGKTSFGGTAKDVLFASAENGLLSVADKNVSYTEISSLKDLQDLYNHLNNKKHSYKTLVIDSITEISDLIKGGIEKRTGRQMQMQDWGTLGRQVEDIIRQMRGLDMNVIVIAQEMLEKDSDKIQKIVPSLYGKSATKITYYMDIVGYLTVDKTGKRTIITSSNEKLVTKDRTQKIGNNTDIDFEKWVELMAGIELKEEEVEFTDNKPMFTKDHLTQLVEAFNESSIDGAKAYFEDIKDEVDMGPRTVFIKDACKEIFTGNQTITDEDITNILKDTADNERAGKFN